MPLNDAGGGQGTRPLCVPFDPKTINLPLITSPVQKLDSRVMPSDLNPKTQFSMYKLTWATVFGILEPAPMADFPFRSRTQFTTPSEVGPGCPIPWFTVLDKHKLFVYFRSPQHGNTERGASTKQRRGWSVQHARLSQGQEPKQTPEEQRGRRRSAPCGLVRGE